MTMDISNLFRTSSAQAAQSAGTVVAPQSTDAKRPAETYVQYGARICGKVTGSPTAFSAMLQKIYNAEKQRQIGDEILQAQRKSEIRSKIESVDSDIAKEKAKVTHTEDTMDDYGKTKSELEELYLEAKHKNGQVNKMARIKMIIGVLILIPLTVYLFSFYTKTFAKGFTGLMDEFTIYFAPIIFFGLGFALHFFAVQKNRVKYVKIAAVLIATFVFDCILAYNIAEAEYIEWANNQLTEVPPYSVSMAAEDLHVWGVIFCGFVAYIIWGIVFDMAMTAYEDMRSNKKEMEQIKSKIVDIKAKIADKRNELLDIRTKMADLELQKQQLTQSLAENVHIDMQVIHTALSDFHAGWIALMPALGLTSEQQDETKSIYESTKKVLFA